jgi:peptidase inhibitor family I36
MLRMARRELRRLAVVALAAAAAVGPPAAPPATAAGSVGDASCDAGELCLWGDHNYRGCFADFTYPFVVPDFRKTRWNTCPDRTLNDDVESYRNHTDSYIFLFTNPKYQGNTWCAYPGASENALNHNPGFVSADNQFSSLKEGPDETGNTTEPEGAGPHGCSWRDYD